MCTTIIILACNYNIIDVSLQLLHTRGRYNSITTVGRGVGYRVLYWRACETPAKCIANASNPGAPCDHQKKAHPKCADEEHEQVLRPPSNLAAIIAAYEEEK